MKHWIQTYTGRQFPFFDCRPEDVSIRDIARALSNLCRFTGHTKQFYSVAQHSFLVSEHTMNPLLGLLHDAAEAYIGDMSRPLKHAGAHEIYAKADECIDAAIRTKFGLIFTSSEEQTDLKEVDLRMLVTEAYDLLEGGPHEEWKINQTTHPRFDFTIHPWHPDEAMQRFLFRFSQLTGMWVY